MILAASLCAAGAIIVALGPPPGMARVATILPARSEQGGVVVPASKASHRHGRGSGPGLLASGRGRAAASLCAAVAAVTLVGGVSGIVIGAGLGVGAWYGLRRLEPSSRQHDRERVVAVLPLTADLLSAALAAGCPPVAAAQIVGTAIGGSLGRMLTDAAASARIGADAERVWTKLAAEPAVRPLARALAAAMNRGTSPGPALQRVAADARDAVRWAGEARARSLGARAAAPLGLCFLPAFVLLGVVPIVATSGVMLL